MHPPLVLFIFAKSSENRLELKKKRWGKRTVKKMLEYCCSKRIHAWVVQAHPPSRFPYLKCAILPCLPQFLKQRQHQIQLHATARCFPFIRCCCCCCCCPLQLSNNCLIRSFPSLGVISFCNCCNFCLATVNEVWVIALTKVAKGLLQNSNVPRVFA